MSELVGDLNDSEWVIERMSEPGLSLTKPIKTFNERWNNIKSKYYMENRKMLPWCPIQISCSTTPTNRKWIKSITKQQLKLK